jgi:endo-alpha-1,4-polygalactosaminidase (GH114 family)
MIALATLVGLLVTAAPAGAQQRQLGPPAGAGDGLEGTAPETPPAPEEAPLIPIPVPKPKPATPVEGITPPDRTKQLLGEVEVLDIPLAQIPNYRDYMRQTIEDLSIYARGRNPKFIIVTRPGFDLLTWSRREFDLEDIKRDRNARVSPDSIVPAGSYMRRYIQRIDGVMLNGEFCAPLRVPRDELVGAQKQGIRLFSIEHCSDGATAAAARQSAIGAGVVAHIDTDAEDTFARVPAHKPSPENAGNVEALAQARNMLVMLDNRTYGSKEEWLGALQATNYDVLVTDAFYKGNQPLSKDDIHTLKFKQMGARRLVLARINLGYAEDERYYWQRDWKIGTPSWIQATTGTPGTYVVEFWNPAWKAIIGKYFAGIMDLGFDGVVLDGVEAYRRFEFMTPLDATH